MSSIPESSGRITILRRRRTRRHSRNRRIRRALLVVICAGLTFGVSSAALRYLTPSLFRTSPALEVQRQSAEASRDALVATQQEALRQIEDRPVYPYSLVAGGVRNVHELKWAAEHDPVVAAHYAGFDYDHARVVRLTLARTVFLSYRIGNKVYWTRHRVTLKKGEEVITDGKKTARTRCANRVEEVPQQATSEAEPPIAKFDEPVMPAVGTGLANPPVPFESSLLNRPGVPGLGPAPLLSLYDPLGGGSFTPISLPPLPGVCGVITKKPGSTGPGTATPIAKGKKKGGDPCGNGTGGVGGEVPEPGTWLLMASGLTGIYWKYRHKFSRD